MKKIKTIAVTGGKGGTGKSTFALILAFREIIEGRKVLLVDCDVECPNDYLLLGINTLDNEIKSTVAYYPKFIESKCKKCGLCVDSCKAGALFQLPGKIPKLEKDLCSSCGVCWTVCPYNAIEKRSTVNGKIFKNVINDSLTLVTGQSIPGVRETSPVVEQVRKYIDEISISFDLIIIDTAAGSHCTVMRALEGVDLAYAVTEPTPVGAHDLRVILQVLKVLDVQSKIVLNKKGQGNENIIKKISSKENIVIDKYIPYDSQLAQIYSEGNFLNQSKYLSNLIYQYK